MRTIVILLVGVPTAAAEPLPQTKVGAPGRLSPERRILHANFQRRSSRHAESRAMSKRLDAVGELLHRIAAQR